MRVNGEAVGTVDVSSIVILFEEGF